MSEQLRFKQKVERLVEAYGSQTELANEVGVRPTVISGWLKGRNPSAMAVKSINRMFLDITATTAPEPPAQPELPNMGVMNINGVAYVPVEAHQEIAANLRALARMLDPQETAPGN